MSYEYIRGIKPKTWWKDICRRDVECMCLSVDESIDRMAAWRKNIASHANEKSERRLFVVTIF